MKIAGLQRKAEKPVFSRDGSTLVIIIFGMFLFHPAICQKQVSTAQVSPRCGASDTISLQAGQQPTLLVKEIKKLDGLPYGIEVRPNPTNDLILIELTRNEAKGFRYVLYDINGRVLAQEELISKVSAIHIKNYPSGLYLLKVMKQQTEIKTFEIIKNS